MDETVQLRVHLRKQTARQHAELDSLAGNGKFEDSADYAQFLLQQYLARQPIEQWVAKNVRERLAPPPVAHLLADDLRDLDKEVPELHTQFALPDNSDILGLSWAIAGSHLGNRMMLRQFRNVNGNAPTRFLADGSMASFWNELKSELEVPVLPEHASGAVRAAEAVFAHFLKVFGAVKNQGSST